MEDVGECLGEIAYDDATDLPQGSTWTLGEEGADDSEFVSVAAMAVAATRAARARAARYTAVAMGAVGVVEIRLHRIKKKVS